LAQLPEGALLEEVASIHWQMDRLSLLSSLRWDS
jgi:hypothetical protein